MMRTFIFYFTLSKCFFDFLIILVTHIFLSNKKPGKPLIVRAFPAFPGQSPTVPTISLFLTFILLGYTEKVPVELLPFHFVSLFYVPDVPWKTAFSGSFFLIYAAEALYHSERTAQQRQNLICLQKSCRILTVLVPGLSSEIPAAESCA